jgi:diaminopropionate ammonia-lyase
VAGLAGAIAACRVPAMRTALGLDSQSRILTFGTEGATDPELYRELVGKTPEEVEGA